MAVQCKHATISVGTPAGNGEIAKTEWNESHDLTGTANKLLGFDGSGDAAEVDKPSSAIVGISDTQDLSNKNYNEKDIELTGTTPELSGTGMRYWTLSGNSTPTDGMTNGDSLTISILDGSARTINWSMVDKVVGGGLPVLDTTRENIVVLWKSNNTVYMAAPAVAAAP